MLTEVPLDRREPNNHFHKEIRDTLKEDGQRLGHVEGASHAVDDEREVREPMRGRNHAL